MIRNKLFFLSILSFLVYYNVIYSLEIIHLPDGRTIKLKDDSTYEIISSKKLIKITFISLSDTSRDRCIGEFSLENNSYGTIYAFDGYVKVFDKNNKTKGNYLEFSEFLDEKSVKVGQKKFDRARFNMRCEEIKKVAISEVRDCVMRNHPENIECYNLISTYSNVPDIYFYKD